MPSYEFENKKGEVVEIFYFHQDAPKIGEQIKVKGVNHTRIASKLSATVDKIDPNKIKTAKDFSNVTGKKVGSVGDLWDLSSELSQKRAEKNDGVDPVAAKYKEEHKKKRKGKNTLKEGISF